jgi:agmatine deiminase
MISVLPEWAAHRAMWTAWPSHPEWWLEDLEPAREEIAAMVKALAKGEAVKVLATGTEHADSARAAFDGYNVEVIETVFNDIWLRDTAPIFAFEGKEKVALGFINNGWGERFDFPLDKKVPAFVAERSGARFIPHDLVLEGGSLDFNGEGTVLTTKQCLLNPNRNPGLSQADIEARLKEFFGVSRVVWLEDGLAGDHTDGHVDNIARFVGPNKVVCMSPSGKGDPNADVYAKIATDLKAQGFEVVRMPSPGLVADEEGEPVAASHMNFIIGNESVVMPSYEDVYAAQALAILKDLFPDREVIALPSSGVLLGGGGSFHCITQQEPA